MGYLYVLMGKSATGKDSIYRRLLGDVGLGLRKFVIYTTRPMRIREVNGLEYNFVTEAELEVLRKEGKVIEERCFNTIDGPWYYFTVNDGSMDLSKADYNQVKSYFGEDKVRPIYIEVSDVELIKRAIRREEKQKHPNVAEICRRFLSDNADFSEENLISSGIDKKYRFQNNNLNICTKEITAFIKEN